MQCQIINSKTQWENFISACQPPTFLQSWNWGELNRQTGQEVFYLGIYDGPAQVAAALVIKVKAKRGTFFHCPHGPVIKDPTETEQILATILTHLKELGKNDVHFIRFSPALNNTPELQQTFQKLGARPSPIHMHPELAWTLDITPDESALLAQMRKTTRYSIKRAEKDGVKIIQSQGPEQLEKFWQIYAETFRRQQFTPFSKNYLTKEFEVFSRDNQIQFFLGEHNGKIISGAMVVFYGDSGFYHQGASTQSKVPASYLLQWAAIQEAKRRGLKKYNFWGVSPEDQPKHPWAGLSLFKKGFGGQSQEYIHAQDFILSPLRYWPNYIIEKFRKIKRGY
ncbi:peptidoglycan bridge formation glycyltransferase FemA/FemB family protein [Candidatus Uhrbacteria bacterium]|nr:peptidoglycan bridge formation glycyltransferase FemA/FemB family protein [Candidatus Uhrbacteria bacterium]